MKLSAVKSHAKSVLILVVLSLNWVGGLISSAGFVLIALSFVYLICPWLGLERLSPMQLLDAILSRPDYCIGLLGLIVAIVAARSFLDSKRLDMRLAAADGMQEFLQSFTEYSTRFLMAAEVLGEVREYVRSQDFRFLGEDETFRCLVERVRKEVGSALGDSVGLWNMYMDLLSLQRRHRLVIGSSSVGSLLYERGLFHVRAMANVRVSFPPDDLDESRITDWARSTGADWTDRYIEAHHKHADAVHMNIGACCGIAAGGVFPNSAVALLSSWKGFIR